MGKGIIGMCLRDAIRGMLVAVTIGGLLVATAPAAYADEPVPTRTEPSPTQAGGTIQPQITGGDVIRHDDLQNLVIAKDIRNYNAGYGGNCNIWNWSGGSTYDPVNPGGNCWTASMNGYTYSWQIWWDTDAFTMQYEGYWVRMRDGKWRWNSANVYTKIQDHENAHCYRESDGVNCYVELG